MNDSSRRAWVSLENAGVDITEDLVANLFQNLMSPFGNQVPFSCIPVQLTDLSRGPPPREWTQVRVVAQQVLAAWEDKERRAAKKRKQRKPVVEGMTDDVVHSFQSKDEASENSDSECNSITFRTEYSPTSQMTSGSTCTNPFSMGLDEDLEENSDDTPYQVTWSVGSGSTGHTSNSDELDGHDIRNPMLELFCPTTLVKGSRSNPCDRSPRRFFNVHVDNLGVLGTSRQNVDNDLTMAIQTLKKSWFGHT